MAYKRPLWSTNLALTTWERFVDLIICYVMAKSPYMPNLGSLSHPHGLEEAPVAPYFYCSRIGVPSQNLALFAQILRQPEAIQAHKPLTA